MKLLTKKFPDARLYYRDDTHDLSMLEEVWIKGAYDRLFPFGQKAVVVDIGAHNGYFSIYASKKLHRDSAVRAYEPIPANYRILQQNIIENQIQNIDARNLAVANESGRVTIYENSAHTGGHSILRDRVEVYDLSEIRALDVPVESFKNAISVDTAQIDFCKIDCEGAEFEILTYAKSQDLRRVKVYAVEFHEFGGHVVTELTKMYIHHGYKVDYRFSPSKRGIRFGMLWAWQKDD